MEKTIKIDSKTSLKLSNSVVWMMIYRDQFGRDIVPVLVPALSAVADVAVEVSKAAQNGATSAQIITALDTDVVKDALMEASGLEFVDFLNIVWAMAKAADDDIDEPIVWIRQFDKFPLDTILPVVFDLILSCMVSTKNLKRLRTAMQSLKPSPSTAS